MDILSARYLVGRSATPTTFLLCCTYDMNENEFPKLDKSAISLVSLDEADNDEVEYWLSKTPYEQLDALETLRQIFYG
jgi:hypothetical protein